MIKEYPIKGKIKERADLAGKTLKAVATEIKKTDRWLQDVQSIDKLTFETVEKLSIALSFDILKDYNDWRIEQGLKPITHLSEPDEEYVKAKKISVNISITASINRFNQNFGDVLEALKREGEKHGFDIDA